MPHRTRAAARALDSGSRLALLHAVQRPGAALGVDDLADETGLHVNTVREHMERLLEAGFVERRLERRAGRGRPRVLYAAVRRPAGATLEATFRERLLAVLADEHRPAAPGDDAVARQLAAVEAHLEDLGLDPEVDTVAWEVHLHRCPFLELARTRTEVVCSVHLDVARGVLASAGGPVRAESLHPFVAPQRCLLRLAVGGPRSERTADTRPAIA